MRFPKISKDPKDDEEKEMKNNSKKPQEFSPISNSKDNQELSQVMNLKENHEVHEITNLKEAPTVSKIADVKEDPTVSKFVSPQEIQETPKITDLKEDKELSQIADLKEDPAISQIADLKEDPAISQITDVKEEQDVEKPEITKSLTPKQAEHVIDYLLKQENATIRPTLNFEENTISYDVLKQIGVDERDSSFLDQLCSTSRSLEKKHFQRLLICPKHNNFSITLHNCCMKCNEQNFSKKYLIEHKLCGSIEEYDITNIHSQSTCSRCKKPITFTKKDCKTHGMWYFCLSCEEKFDKPKTELYCRKGNHSLKMEETTSKDIFCYGHQHATDPASKIMLSIKNKIFSHYPSENNVTVLGKSGMGHIVDMMCTINGEKYGIFLKHSDEEITETDFHSILLKILDLSDLIPIIILIPSVNETVRNLISSHNIVALIGDDPEEIFEQLLKSVSP